MVGHCINIDITAIDHNLVKSFLGFVEHLFLDGIGDDIDEIRFLPHQKIDGSVLFVMDVGYDLFEGHQSNLRCFTVIPLLMS